MRKLPIVLVPGFWLGAWAWDDVTGPLREAGHHVTALTLPGLEAAAADRSRIRFDDHVAAIRRAVETAAAEGDGQAVLAVHSGAGASGYAVTDVVPERIARMVYVDSGPASGAINPGFEGPEWPLPSWQELEDDGNSLAGLSPEQLERFRARAVPEPAGAIREGASLANPARLDVPTTMICSTFGREELLAAAAEGWPWIAGLTELRDVEYVDLPTGHWPMWSRPADLADLLGSLARTTP